jgi:hypothetical protein
MHGQRWQKWLVWVRTEGEDTGRDRPRVHRSGEAKSPLQRLKSTLNVSGVRAK